MKLATFRNGTRDGALVVVSRDLTKAVTAESAIAGLRTLQQLLDDWQNTGLAVERIYAELNEVAEGVRMAPFEVVDTTSPWLQLVGLSTDPVPEVDTLVELEIDGSSFRATVQRCDGSGFVVLRPVFIELESVDDEPGVSILRPLRGEPAGRTDRTDRADPATR